MATIYSNGIVVTKAAVSITTTTVYYALSVDGSCPDISEFTPEIKTISADFPYLWSYTVIEKSNNTKDETKPTLIGSFGVDGKSPMAVILSSESFVFPVDEDGDGGDYSNLIVAVTVMQGAKTLSAVNIAPTEKGTFQITYKADGVTMLECQDNYVKSSSSTAMTDDSGLITLTINYLNFDGDSGSFEKTITLSKQKQGKIGAYTLRQYCLSTDSENSPVDGWVDTYPDMINETRYLWIRSKSVPAGGNADEIDWGKPVISTIGIKVTEDKIAFNADKTRFVVNNEEIQADGVILKDNSVSADKMEAEILFASDMQIADRLVDGKTIKGKIRSKGYNKGEWNRDLSETETESDRATGFYMDNEGHLEATRGNFRRAKMYDMEMVGGTIAGENNPLNTVLENTSGASYTDNGKTSGYKKRDDIISFVNTNIPTINKIGDKSGFVEFEGYQIGNLQPTNYYSIPEGEITWSKTKTGSYGTEGDLESYNIYDATYTFSFQEVLGYDAICSFSVTSIIQQKDTIGYGANSFWPNGTWEYHKIWNTVSPVSYKINNGSYVDLSFTTTKDSTLTYGSDYKTPNVSSAKISTSFILPIGSSGTVTIKVSGLKEATNTSGIYAELGYRKEEYKFSSTSTFSFSQKDNCPSGRYAINGTALTSLSDIFNTLSPFVLSPTYGNSAMSQLSDYALFNGLKKDGVAYTDSLLVTATSLVIAGTSYSGDCTVAYSGGILSISRDAVVILTLATNTYYLSSDIKDFSFTEVLAYKGVYVDDVFPRKNSSGKYCGTGAVGTASQPFPSGYIESLEGKTAKYDTFYGTLSGFIGSQGNLAPYTGRNVIGSGVYTYNIYATNGDGLPSGYYSVIGFGRGTSGCAEIAIAWTNNTSIYIRSLRDTENSWFSWQRLNVINADCGSVYGAVFN